MNIADALSGRAELPGLRWVLLHGTPHRALRHELTTLLAAPTTLGSCRLRQARFTAGRKLLAYYDVSLRIQAGKARYVRPIVVTWRADGKPDRHYPTAGLADMQAEALRRRVAAPFLRLVADAPAWGMHVQVSPLDPCFRQLVGLCVPEYVQGLLQRAEAAGGGFPGQPSATRYRVTSIRYRPGKRHVLRYDSLEPRRRGTVFAKLYAGEDGQRIFRLAAQVANWLAEGHCGLASVRPLSYVAGDSLVLYPRVPGTPLHEHLHHRGRDLAPSLEQAGAGLHRLQKLPQSFAGTIEVHDFAMEVGEIVRASRHLSALLPAVGATVDAILDRAQQLHERLPQERPTFIHGDFKCEHLWATPDGLSLIDFDSCHLSDPALDVGKFLADLQLWYDAYALPGVDQAQERFLVGYGHRASDPRLIRARLYEAIQLVKITARRVGLFEHDWVSRTERLIGRAQAVMNNLHHSLGFLGAQLSSKALVVMFERARGVCERRDRFSAKGGRV